MGCAVEKLPTGTQIDVHRFDNLGNAMNYVTVARAYKFDRHEPWAFTPGYDFYQGPQPNQKASIYFKENCWTAAIWEQ
jgi:hypothetical protein